MKKFKAIFLLACLVVLTCLPMQAVQADQGLKVGILQFSEVDALSDSTQGIKEVLEAADQPFELTVENANGDMNSLQSMAEKLVRENDILVAVSTPSLQALSSLEKQKPIFFVTVSDPVGAGAVESIERPGRNVTGVSNMSPIKEQLAILQHNFPEAQKVGVVYNSSEVNSQAQLKVLREEAEAADLELIEGTITSTNDIQQVLQATLSQIDVLFLVTDLTIESAISLVGDIAKEAKMPTVGSADTTVETNALMTYSNSYVDYGRQMAEMLVRWQTEDLAIEDMAVEYGKNFQLVVNEDFAKAIDLDPAQLTLPPSLE